MPLIICSNSIIYRNSEKGFFVMQNRNMSHAWQERSPVIKMDSLSE